MQLYHLGVSFTFFFFKKKKKNNNIWSQKGQQTPCITIEPEVAHKLPTPTDHIVYEHAQGVPVIVSVLVYI